MGNNAENKKEKGRTDSEKEKWRNRFVKKKRYKIYYEFSKISGIMRVDTTCIMSVIYKVPVNEIPPQPSLNMYTVFIRLSAKPQISAHLE